MSKMCDCANGVCMASHEGGLRGYMSIISDARCRARAPAAIVDPDEIRNTFAADVAAEDAAALRPPHAIGLLEEAAKHMADRAKTYDRPEGERSMAATVLAFNALTRHELAESEGWLFMELLKAARDFSVAGGHADSQEDRIAYAALGAEARRAGR